MAVILVIDDEPQIREVWAAALEAAGYEVRTASSGVEGVAIARREPVDLVITDILMPEKDGIETLLELKAEMPRLKVITVSGGGTISTGSFLGAAEKLGADATLQKPVNLRDMCRTVAELLDEDQTPSL